MPMDHATPMMNDENWWDVEHMVLALMVPKEIMMLLDGSFSFAHSNFWNYV